MIDFLKQLKNNKLTGSFGIYFGSSLINAAVPFLMLPIFTHYLSPADFGIISLFSVFGGFLMPFIGFSTIGVLSREYFNKDILDFGQYIGNIVLLVLFSLIPVTLILYVFSDVILKFLDVPREVLWFSLIFSVFSFLINTILVVWQAQSQAVKYGIFQISQTLLNIALSSVFIIWLNLGWQGRILAQVLVSIIFGIVGVYFVNKVILLNFKFNKKYILDAFNVGLPLIPHSLGAIMISMSDRIFISNMVGIEATGIYALGYSIGNIIGFVENSFNLAYAPWLFEKLNLKDDFIKMKIVKYTYMYFIFILTMALLLTIFIPLFFEIFIDKKFVGAQVYIFWISLSFAFSGMYKMVTNYIFYVKKTHILAWVTFGSALVNIVLNYILIRIYGAIGAAISATIVSFLFFMLTWILSNYVYKMPWLSAVKRRV
jgi:O-antigen/teichoic acid export membrane protein